MEPYVIDRIPIASVDANVISTTYVAAGKAVILTDVLDPSNEHSPWRRCAKMSDFRFYSTHTEVSKLTAEINVQKYGKIQRAEDFEMDNVTAEAAMDLLQLRQTEDPTTARTGTDASDDVLYVKLSLTSCSALMQELDLQSFANPAADSKPFVPSEHPLLLGPSSYFCWAYIGEAGTGSKTHVDVASSDAFLTVLHGRKEWAMVHPLDKHLVTAADGTMADLFAIDYVAFPEAKRARLCLFEQRAGDCVYVPSDAPHCVRNVEASVSITYNFSAPSTTFRYHAALDKVMSPRPSIATVDLLVFCPAVRQRTVLRAYVKELPAPLPTTDFDIRMVLEKFHAAFGIYGRYLDHERTAAVPLGFELCSSSHRIIYYYRMDSADNFKTLFNQPPFASEPYAHDVAVAPPANCIFRSVSSHYGPVTLFPPLRVLVNQPLLSGKIFDVCNIAEATEATDCCDDSKEANGSDGNPFTFISDGQPASSEGGRVTAEKYCRGNDGKRRQWHYSRFPFTYANGPSRWCRTFLFYSSHDVHGPVSLHPIVEDTTLQSRDMLAKEVRHAGGSGDDKDAAVNSEKQNNNMSFQPHFESFEWRDQSVSPPNSNKSNDSLLYALGGNLIGAITERIVLSGQGEAFRELLAVAGQHGLKGATAAGNAASDDVAALLDMGLEKILILVLYFCCMPRVVGFSYSHTFSAVEEPGTVCLTASAADALLKPLPNDEAAIALSRFCDAVDPLNAKDNTVAPPTEQSIKRLGIDLLLAFPNHPDIVGKVRAVKAACNAKVNATPITEEK